MAPLPSVSFLTMCAGCSRSGEPTTLRGDKKLSIKVLRIFTIYVRSGGVGKHGWNELTCRGLNPHLPLVNAPIWFTNEEIRVKADPSHYVIQVRILAPDNQYCRMIIDSYIIKNEVDAFFYAMVIAALIVGIGIGWIVGRMDGKETLHDGWIIRNKHNMTKGL